MRTLLNEGVDDAAAGEDEAPAARRTSPLAAGAVALAVIVGVALRFYSTSALWLDEALSVNIASLPPGEILDALRHDGHPPLYYLLLHYWMELAGDGDAAVRALSGIIGVATLPVAWLAGRRVAGASGARWALVVAALSPYTVRYSTETRMYVLVMFLVLVGYLVLDDALRSPTAGRLLAVAGVSGALLLTHYWAFYLLGTVGLLLIAKWWRDPVLRPVTLRVIVSVAAGGVLFLPWLGGFLYQGAHTGTPWGAPYRPTELVQSTLNDVGGGLVSEAFLAGTLLVVLVMAALFVTRATPGEMSLDLRTTPLVRRELMVVAGTAAVGCVAGYVTSSTYQSRYAAVFVPLLLLAVAVGITRFVGPARVVIGGAWVVLALGGLVWLQYFERTQSEDVAAAVAGRVEPGDIVVYCPDQLGPAFSRAMGPGVEQVAYPTLGSPERVDWVDYGERNAAADPEAVADELRERAGSDNAVFVVWMGQYRTLEGQCEELINNLGRGDKIVSEDGAKYFEPANVHWFPAGRLGPVEGSAAANIAAG